MLKPIIYRRSGGEILYLIHTQESNKKKSRVLKNSFLMGEKYRGPLIPSTQLFHYCFFIFLRLPSLKGIIKAGEGFLEEERKNYQIFLYILSKCFLALKVKKVLTFLDSTSPLPFNHPAASRLSRYNFKPPKKVLIKDVVSILDIGCEGRHDSTALQSCKIYKRIVGGGGDRGDKRFPL